ncbi:hypothetical protein ABGV40_09220 [Paenibacillus amylolyticus]|uniref:hypothetical protein n=1 Tax=Paenibacillus amylolyticus TaxID=1451 RepID=UPI003241D85C
MQYEKIGEHIVTPLKVCQSHAGYYIGRLDEYGGPFSRNSKEYFKNLEEAKSNFLNGNWTPRDTGSIKISLDYNLITEFRNVVNEHEFYIGLLRDSNGKNKWNLVCSCMDWISVVAGSLHKLYDFNSDKFTVTLNLMQYITSVDILSEAITQLYRVIKGNDLHPLKTDKSIFKQENSTDDNYFKHLRAAFGIHPINLTSKDGTNKNNNRYFASWTSNGWFYEGTFSVVLYSNDPYEEDSVLELDLWDINKYALSRYNLLYDLISEVKIIINKHIKKYLEVPIYITGEPIDQLEVLKTENSKRFGNHDGYWWEIDIICKLIKSSSEEIEKLDLQIVNGYRNYLISLIPEIKIKLENLEYNDESLGDSYSFIPNQEYIITLDNNVEKIFIEYAMYYNQF